MNSDIPPDLATAGLSQLWVATQSSLRAQFSA